MDDMKQDNQFKSQSNNFADEEEENNDQMVSIFTEKN